MIKALESRWGHENSDPAKVAQVVLLLAATDCLPAHLLIGSDAVRHAGQAEATRAADAERWREVSVSTDADAPTSMCPCLHCNFDRSVCSMLITLVESAAVFFALGEITGRRLTGGEMARAFRADGLGILVGGL